jgi:glutaconyl-CoA/methylmalonyl-CoA decarboxylase subunit gamma
MHRKFRITVDGRAYDVVVEEIADEAPAPTPAGARPVAAAAHAAPSASAAGPGDEVAPLAGVVESIEVTVGEAIAAGAKIATIEAMKMKTEVFARSAGKVIAIVVKPGEPVDAGGVLLTLG